MARYRLLTAGAALVALLATGVVFAQGPPGGGRFGRGPMMGPGRGPGLALGALNLTDAQRGVIQDIRMRHRDELQAASQKLADVQEKQRQAIEALPVNEALITSLSQDLAQAQIDTALAEARLNADIWAALTPDQQAQLTKIRADREARMAERRQQMQQRRQNRQQ